MVDLLWKHTRPGNCSRWSTWLAEQEACCSTDESVLKFSFKEKADQSGSHGKHCVPRRSRSSIRQRNRHGTRLSCDRWHPRKGCLQHFRANHIERDTSLQTPHLNYRKSGVLCLTFIFWEAGSMLCGEALAVKHCPVYRLCSAKRIMLSPSPSTRASIYWHNWPHVLNPGCLPCIKTCVHMMHIVQSNTPSGYLNSDLSVFDQCASKIHVVCVLYSSCLVCSS